jgi:hypothetical protein
LKRRKQKSIVVGEHQFFWLVNGEYGPYCPILRIWMQSAPDAVRPLEVHIQCFSKAFDFRPITPGVVRQVIEDAIAIGWMDTGGRTPLRFDWDRDGQPEYRLLPWRSLGD